MNRIRGLSFVVAAAAAAVLSSFGSGAQGAILTQTVNIPAQTIINNTTVNVSTPAPVGATFDKFNPALGTLTGVAFDYDYDFNVEVTYGSLGGSVNASAGGPFVVNGTAEGGNGGGGGNSGTPFTYAISPFSVTGTYNVAAFNLPGFASAAPGATNTFVYDNGAALTFSGGGGTGTYRLLDTSSVKVTYTYDAIPEPASLGVLALAGAGALLRRRNV